MPDIKIEEEGGATTTALIESAVTGAVAELKAEGAAAEANEALTAIAEMRLRMDSLQAQIDGMYGRQGYDDTAIREEMSQIRARLDAMEAEEVAEEVTEAIEGAAAGLVAEEITAVPPPAEEVKAEEDPPEQRRKRKRHFLN
jgi:hypothetical protein